MPDFKGAVQAAFYQALAAAPSVTGDSSVFQHVPEGEQLGGGEAWVVLGETSSEPAGGKDGGLDRVTVQIFVVANELDQTALTRRQAAVRDAIEGAALPEQEGVLLSRPVFEGDDASIEEDGLTYAGLQRFSVFAQEADPLIYNGDLSEQAPPPVLGGAEPPSVSGGQLVFPGSGTAAWPVADMAAGSFYRLTFSLKSIDPSGGVTVSLGGLVSLSYTAAEDDIVQYVLAGGADSDLVLASSAPATVDDVRLEGPFMPTEGPELVVDGGADDASGWTVGGTNAEIAAGLFHAGGGLGTKSYLRAASGALVRGHAYRGRVDIVVRIAGTAGVHVGGTTAGGFASPGAKQVDLIGGGASQSVGLVVFGSGNMDLDNLSIRELLFD